MPILTVRLTDEEKRILEERSRKAGVKKAAFVRQLIRETPFESSMDVLADLEKRMGDKRLRIDK
ncbi:MAG: ribbon-helix-helix protein, CopG family [Verrucomicrobia bacterium]|nr:ribbon-helix-helix protein, CopG family [Verrucomicrobiota bacterium]